MASIFIFFLLSFENFIYLRFFCRFFGKAFANSFQSNFFAFSSITKNLESNGKFYCNFGHIMGHHVLCFAAHLRVIIKLITEMKKFEILKLVAKFELISK